MIANSCLTHDITANSLKNGKKKFNHADLAENFVRLKISHLKPSLLGFTYHFVLFKLLRLEPFVFFCTETLQNILGHFDSADIVLSQVCMLKSCCRINFPGRSIGKGGEADLVATLDFLRKVKMLVFWKRENQLKLSVWTGNLSSSPLLSLPLNPTRAKEVDNLNSRMFVVECAPDKAMIVRKTFYTVQAFDLRHEV